MFDPSLSAAPWWAFWRKHDDGLIPPEQHRCKPPKCHEWPAGEWKVDRNLDLGTAWVCPTCGQRWTVTLGSGGLWKVWEESYDNA